MSCIQDSLSKSKNRLNRLKVKHKGCLEQYGIKCMKLIIIVTTIKLVITKNSDIYSSCLVIYWKVKDKYNVVRHTRTSVKIASPSLPGTCRFNEKLAFGLSFFAQQKHNLNCLLDTS